MQTNICTETKNKSQKQHLEQITEALKQYYDYPFDDLPDDYNSRIKLLLKEKQKLEKMLCKVNFKLKLLKMFGLTDKRQLWLEKDYLTAYIEMFEEIIYYELQIQMQI